GVEVPDLRGMTLSEVYSDKEIMENFYVVQGEIEFSDKYEKDEIMDQDPSPHRTAEKGTTITVTVSGGQEAVEMIDVTNYTYEEAVKALQALGLKVAAPEYEYSEDVEKDWVISYTPPEGTELYPGDQVHLVISKGPESMPVVVPSVTGQSLEKAKKMLEDLGLTVAGTEEVASDQPAGTVVYQSIAPSTEVEKGTAVTLHYSKGPEAKPITSKPITVVLPADPESVTVRITLDGQEIYNDVVSTSAGTLVTTANGTGSQEVCIYIDDQLVDQYTLNFDA
ncbi:MAG: PASTA domain-containing protein, partial [Ruminiclostridium sp.]|nr:PASTA domain-containing protein [Ruminiclostridium sp.]